jgi:hypothetical protein
VSSHCGLRVADVPVFRGFQQVEHETRKQFMLQERAAKEVEKHERAAQEAEKRILAGGSQQEQQPQQDQDKQSA